jgi:hypothetical protein
LFAGMLLAVPLVVDWLVSKVTGTGQLGQALTSVSAMLSVVAVWLRCASGAVSKVDQAIAKVNEAYEKQIQDDEKVKKAEEDLKEATSNAAMAAEKMAIAEREMRKAEAEAAAASLPAQMLTLVSSRVDDRTYSKELTTVSIAREDLRQLSQILQDQAKAPTAPTPAASAIKPAHRVILYIDDLDRCRPDDVVRVLQVVHMLLAFELFVVVVAVDARWVEESLKQKYGWLAGADGHARVTPQDYLEKIFQTTFWLEPMTTARAAEYLKSLVQTSRRRSGSAVDPSTDSGRTSSGATESIEIHPLELEYMCALAAYVGPSPRRVKRLVNAYRLLKARMSDAQLSSFLTNRTTEDGAPRSGPYQLVIGLLVIGTGVPTSAAQIMRELAERDPQDELDDVIKSFRERNQKDWTVAAQVLEMLMRTQKSQDVSELRGWARKVGRFLLQGPTEVVTQIVDSSESGHRSI